jgi:hypothetical protein
MFWLIDTYTSLGIAVGLVFCKAGKTEGTIWRAQIADLDPMFHAVLK